jgi:hypothetical protein
MLGPRTACNSNHPACPARCSLLAARSNTMTPWVHQPPPCCHLFLLPSTVGASGTPWTTTTRQDWERTWRLVPRGTPRGSERGRTRRRYGCAPRSGSGLNPPPLPGQPHLHPRPACTRGCLRSHCGRGFFISGLKKFGPLEKGEIPEILWNLKNFRSDLI